MKLLKVITILSSLVFLTNCSSTTGNTLKPTEINGVMAEMPAPVFFGDNLEYSMPQFLWRSTQYLRFRLNKDEKKMHQSAVFFMLNNAKNGEIVSWYSESRDAGGKVRPIFTYGINSSLCRDFQVLLYIDKKARSKTFSACRFTFGTGFSFNYWDWPGAEKYLN